MRIQLLIDNEVVAEIELEEGDQLIGSAKPSNILIEDPSVSLTHAKIFQQDGIPFIADLGSEHGTLVAGIQVGVPTELKDGDHVQIGEFLFQVKILGDPPHPGDQVCPDPPRGPGARPKPPPLPRTMPTPPPLPSRGRPALKSSRSPAAWSRSLAWVGLPLGLALLGACIYFWPAKDDNLPSFHSESPGKKEEKRSCAPKFRKADACIAFMNDCFADLDRKNNYPAFIEAAQQLPSLLAQEHGKKLKVDFSKIDREFMAPSEANKQIEALKLNAVSNAQQVMKTAMSPARFPWLLTMGRNSTDAKSMLVPPNPITNSATMRVAVDYFSWQGERSSSPPFDTDVLQMKGDCRKMPGLFYVESSPFNSSLKHLLPLYIDPENKDVSIRLPDVQGKTAKAIKEQKPRLEVEKTVTPILRFSACWQNSANHATNRLELPLTIAHDTRTRLLAGDDGEILIDNHYTISELEVRDKRADSESGLRRKKENTYDKQLRQVLGLPATESPSPQTNAVDSPAYKDESGENINPSSQPRRWISGYGSSNSQPRRNSGW